MLKRSYVVFSIIAALGIGTALTFDSVGSADAQKDKNRAASADEQKDNEKAAKEYKEKVKEFELLSTPGFAFSTVVGSGSYLGVYLEEVSSERAKELKLAEERGAIVMKVVEGGPADKAGLKENDTIVSFNGRRIDTVRELQRLLGETPAGRSVSFEVIRDGSQHSLNATLTNRSPEVGVWRQGRASPEALQNMQGALKRAEELGKLSEKRKDLFQDFGNYNFVAPGKFMFYRGSRLGIGVESLTNQLAEFFGVKSGHGVLVSEVKTNGAAAKAGLKAGDVITAVDGQKVEDVAALLEATSKKEGGTVSLTIVRNRSEQTVTLTVEKPERRGLQAPAQRTKVTAGNSSSL